MKADVVFAGVFLVLVVVTLVIPGLPPGELLTEFLGFPPVTGSSLGVFLATILTGVVNGLLWGLVAVAMFWLSCHGSRRAPLPSMPVADGPRSTSPRPKVVAEHGGKTSPVKTLRKEDLPINQDVKTIEGIGAVRGRLFDSVGVKTVDDLLKAGATSEGRAYLAANVGVSDAMVLSWVQRGDLLRVKGVGKQYSGLLETAGVSSVTNLASRKAHSLRQTLKRVNREKKLVKRVPPLKTIEIWVSNAEELAPIVS